MCGLIVINFEFMLYVGYWCFVGFSNKSNCFVIEGIYFLIGVFRLFVG